MQNDEIESPTRAAIQNYRQQLHEYKAAKNNQAIANASTSARQTASPQRPKMQEPVRCDEAEEGESDDEEDEEVMMRKYQIRDMDSGTVIDVAPDKEDDVADSLSFQMTHSTASSNTRRFTIIEGDN